MAKKKKNSAAEQPQTAPAGAGGGTPPPDDPATVLGGDAFRPTGVAVDWKPSPFCKYAYDDVAVFAREFMRMHNNGTAVTVETVIDASRNPASPLYRYLHGVSDAQIRQEWLRMTAGKMIRSVQLQISYTDNRTGARTVDRTRAFYSVPAERQSDTTTGRAGSHGTYVNRRYVPVTEVVTTPEYVASVVDDIRQRMQQLIAAQDFLLQRAEQFRPALVAMMNELARDIEQAG